MLRSLPIFLILFVACLVVPHNSSAQTQEKPELTKQPTLYVVGYAHLDTEWRWEYPQVINEYIRKTMEDNFRFSRSIRITSSISAEPIAIGS